MLLPEMAAKRFAQLLISLDGRVCSHNFRVEVEHFFDIVGQEQVGQQPRIYERLRELVADRHPLNIGHGIRQHVGGYCCSVPFR
ncbi:hypothetical protein D3C73_1488410 [compost metagenome]